MCTWPRPLVFTPGIALGWGSVIVCIMRNLHCTSLDKLLFFSSCRSNLWWSYRLPAQKVIISHPSIILWQLFFFFFHIVCNVQHNAYLYMLIVVDVWVLVKYYAGRGLSTAEGRRGHVTTWPIKIQIRLYLVLTAKRDGGSAWNMVYALMRMSMRWAVTLFP